MAFNLGEFIKDVKKAEEPRKSDNAEESVPLEVIFDPSIELDEELEDEDDEDETDYDYEEEEEEEENDEFKDEFADEDDNYFEDDEDDEPLVEFAQFRPYEEDNLAYAAAVHAYYDERNYELAIGKFQDAIDNERERGARMPNEIIAKSMYWQAESYVKTEAFEHATAVLESLIQLFTQTGRGHYLVVAAQRRLETLKARGASHAKNF